jgi:hypothetical protein
MEFMSLNVKYICRAAMNSRSHNDGQAHFCGKKEANIHTLKNRQLVELAWNAIHIGAPTSNSNHAVLIRPFTEKAGFDGLGIVVMLALQCPLIKAISFATLMQDHEGVIGGVEVASRWSEFIRGNRDNDLEDMGLPTPKSTKGPGLASTPGSQFTMGPWGPLSPMTKRGETFQTARADDWLEAASEYDPAQTTYILKQVADLSDYYELGINCRNSKLEVLK